MQISTSHRVCANGRGIRFASPSRVLVVMCVYDGGGCDDARGYDYDRDIHPHRHDGDANACDMSIKTVQSI